LNSDTKTPEAVTRSVKLMLRHTILSRNVNHVVF
jgi:hypothetical protein